VFVLVIVFAIQGRRERLAEEREEREASEEQEQ